MGYDAAPIAHWVAGQQKSPPNLGSGGLLYMVGAAGIEPATPAV